MEQVHLDPDFEPRKYQTIDPILPSIPSPVAQGRPASCHLQSLEGLEEKMVPVLPIRSDKQFLYILPAYGMAI